LYLPSKLKFKPQILIFLAISLFFLGFTGFVRGLVFLTANQLLHFPTTNRRILSELRTKNLELELKLAEYKTLNQENQKLKKALDFKTSKNYKLVGAEVLAFSPSIWQRSVVINVGAKQGISKGLFAINHEANLLGKVVEVADNYSRLILVTDPAFSTTVFIGPTTRGLLKGGVTGARVLYVADDDKVNLGDKIWLKIGELNAPIEIGQVKHLSKDEDSLFWNVEVELFQRVAFFNQVYIVQ